jgi:hypothetical protein
MAAIQDGHLNEGIISMPGTTVIRDTVQQAAEQRFAESTVKILEQRTVPPATAEAPVAAEATLNQAAAATTAAQARIIEKVTTTARDLTSLTQGSVAASLQASQILATGSPALLREVIASSRAVYAEALSGFSALVAARTVHQGIDLQFALVRASTNRAFAEAARLTTAGLDLAANASAPLTDQATRAAEVLTPFKA